MGSNEQNPRQPNDLTGLLKLCIQNATGGGDDVQNSEFETDEERRRFLAAALSSLTQSPIDQLKKGIEFVNNRLNEIDSQGSNTDVNEAVGSIQDCVDNIILDIVSNIDFANDFYKVQGLELVKRLMATRIPKLIVSACAIIAETVQNNPTSQNVVTESGLLVDLLQLVNGSVTLKRTHEQMEQESDDQQRDDVHVKALYAVSCLIRENDTSLKVFESTNGYQTLVKAIQSRTANHKLRIKASFLLLSLVQTHPTIIKTLNSMDFIPTIVTVLAEPHDDSHEHILSLVHLLVTEDQESRNQVAKSGLRTVLDNKIKQLNQEENVEEINFCDNIIKLCYN